MAQPPNWVFSPEPSPTVAPVAAVVAELTPMERPRPGKDLLGDTVDMEMSQHGKGRPEEAFGAAMLLGQGREFESQGRYYEAWGVYKDFLKQYPKDKRGWAAMNGFYARRLTERARKLEKEKRYFEAAKLYHDVVIRDASEAGAWWGLGNIFYKYRKKDQALFCFRKVLKPRPKMKELRKWLEAYDR
jgi:tetratricopeptide (TPR) repeat protein